MGIFTLSSQVFNGNQKVARRKNPPPQKKRYPPLYPRVRDRSYDYARRSSRLKEMETEKSLKEMGISIPEDWTTEVYTEEDEKLLGDCETIWSLELEADGLDEDGDRLYDLERPPCHQCRQRRAGKFTYCGKCRTPHGQICGECLYTRYGENVLEARQNPTWSCPACRGMCNCSRCRRTKGWDPINIPHSKVIESGFKSVAHYIILTRRVGATPKELNDGAEVVDLTPEEIAAAPRDEGSDYSAEWSGAESDDSDSEDETKGDKNNEEQPDKNDEEQLEENQVASAAKSIEAAVATDRDEVL
uniref:Zinc-finger domain-containing protein n=1 Tax=Chenopodium quinoa TaxID=63459 RepID=A0A803LNX2_CHEQI